MLFFNSKKQGKQLDRRGSTTINAIEYELADWNHTTHTGMVWKRADSAPKWGRYATAPGFRLRSSVRDSRFPLVYAGRPGGERPRTLWSQSGSSLYDFEPAIR